jgi:hypothetical protein
MIRENLKLSSELKQKANDVIKGFITKHASKNMVI